MAGPPQIGPGTFSANGGAARNPRSNAFLIAPPAPPARNPSLVPFLAIQLLVLAFFIILTSHTTLNAEKARAVTESVQRKFSGMQDNVAAGAQGGALEPEARDVLQNVLVAFQGLIPLDRNVRHLSALEQTIKLPVELFFAGDSTEVLDSRRSLIDEVMRALDLRPAGWGYELEILVQGNPPSALTLDRAANLAAALAQEGRGQPSIVVAMGRGDPAWMVLMVRLRPNQTAPDQMGPDQMGPAGTAVEEPVP